MNSKYYKEILDKLERLNKREYILAAFWGIQLALLIGSAVFTFFVLLEAAAHFSAAVRTVMFFLFVLIFIALFIYLFIIPVLKYLKLFRNSNYYLTAKKVGKNFPSIQDDLLNAMQLIADQEKKPIYSLELIDAAFKNVYNRTKNLRFENIVNFKKAKDLLLYFGGTVAFCAVLILFIPGINAASFRLLNYNSEFTAPPKFVFDVNPGDTKVTKGNPLEISVKVEGAVPKQVFLGVKDSDQTNFELQPLALNSSGIYKFQVPSVRNSFNYFAEAKNIKSRVYNVSVIDRPIIKTLNLSVISPSYSKIPPVEQKDNGNISALKGSVAELRLSSTKSLKKAEIMFGDSTKANLGTEEINAEGRFIVKKDNTYKIILTDDNNNNNSDPITYTIKALQDAYPEIEAVSPNQDVNLPSDNRLPLDVKINDDYGFTKLLLHYRLSSSRYETPQKDFKSVEIPINKDLTQQEINYIWNISDMNLTAEDVVTYYLEVFDNDIISGPKSARTSDFAVRVPTLDEVLNNAGNSQTQSEEDLQQTSEEAEQLKQNLDQINNELKQNKKDISWQEKQKIQQAMDKFKQLQDKVSKAQQYMQKAQENLQQHNLLSKETLEKYMELQKLFDQMTNSEMKKAMEKLNDVLQNLDRQKIQDEMQNMTFNEDQFKKSVERTINLLKRIEISQKMDELQKRSDQITKDQNDLMNQTKKNDSQNNSDQNTLQKKQNDISKNLDEFSKQMDELQKKMDDVSNTPKDMMSKLENDFDKQNNQQLSKEASQNIQQNQNQQAEQNQMQVSQNMQQMSKGIQQMQKSMEQQNQMQTFKDMMKITDNLLTLSKQQEALKKQSENMDPNSSSFNQNSEQQNELQQNLDNIMQQMSSLSQKTFAITPEMGKSLGDAENEMNESIQTMQQRNGSKASDEQGAAMKSLNEAAAMMKNSMEAMMQGNGGSGGTMPLMQQLQQMSQQQTELNNLTQMLHQSMEGKLNMQQQAELQRLAQQQDIIRKSLQQLNKEAQQSGQSKTIPADLNEIAKKMQEVVKNMQNDDVNEQTLQEQEHILSKLLDAQRSINTRDFEKERESTSGKDVAEKSPPPLDLSSQNSQNKVRDALINSVQEGYSKDYEELIKKYYEALQKENTNK
jgi:Domain of unknown function (DUF4175)